VSLVAIDIEGAKIDFLSLFMCPLLAQLKIGFFSSFSDAAVYSTNEANKAGLKQSIIFRCLCLWHNGTARLKNVNNCLNTNIYSYLETSGGQSCNIYLNVVNFFKTRVK
jgi:hypothetical protein